ARSCHWTSTMSCSREAPATKSDSGHTTGREMWRERSTSTMENWRRSFRIGPAAKRPNPLSTSSSTTSRPPAQPWQKAHDYWHRCRSDPLPEWFSGSGAGALDLSLPLLYNGVYPSKGMGSDESEERVAKDTSWTLLSTAVN